MEADLFNGETEKLRMHAFLKAARKRKLGAVKPKAVAMSEVDNMDTLLMEVADDGLLQECWKRLETNQLWKDLCAPGFICV